MSLTPDEAAKRDEVRRQVAQSNFTTKTERAPTNKRVPVALGMVYAELVLLNENMRPK